MTNSPTLGVLRPPGARVNGAAIFVCLLALVYLGIAKFLPTNPIPIPGTTLAPVDPLEPEISGSGFELESKFPAFNVPPYIYGVPLYSSANQGDSALGTVRTRWYRPLPSFYLLLCGYPALVGGDVFLEVFSPKTGVTPVRFRFDENPENWRLQELSLSAYPDATKFRLVAVDNSQKMQGWLGFSPPLTCRSHCSKAYPGCGGNSCSSFFAPLVR